MFSKLQKKRAVLPQKSYVELFVVVDHNRVIISSNAKYILLLHEYFFSLTFSRVILQFLQKKSDPAAVQKETVELINYVDGVGQRNCPDLVVSTLS